LRRRQENPIAFICRRMDVFATFSDYRPLRLILEGQPDILLKIDV
jgi:hypothetical protein